MELQKVENNSTTCISVTCITVTATNTHKHHYYYQHSLSAQCTPETHRLNICVEYLEVFLVHIKCSQVLATNILYNKVGTITIVHRGKLRH